MKTAKLTYVSLALLFGVGQAIAHTGVRDAVGESTTSYNGFTITHGCGGDSGKPYPVVGQSAVFPFGDDIVWRDGSGAVLQEGGTGGVISGASLTLGLTGYANASSAFATNQEIVDDLGNVRGMLWKDGAMEPKLNTITPFRVGAPNIDDASGIKCLKVRIGVINYCDIGKNEANDASKYSAPKDAFGRAIPDLTDEAGGDQANVNGSPVYKGMGTNGDNNRADWWFKAPYGVAGSAYYQDPDLIQPDYWTTMTVLNTSAGITSASQCGDAVVSVEPTAAAFDTILNPANTKPFSSGNGPQ